MKIDIPTDVAKAITDGYRSLMARMSSPYVIVRSSATSEDLKHASFAVQYESVFPVYNERTLFDAIRRCWASVFAPHVILYCKERAIDYKNILMSVIVQELILSRSSGVMFTVHPTTGENVVYISSSWGFGKAITDGVIEPDVVIVSKEEAKILERRLGRKEFMYSIVSDKLSLLKTPSELQNKLAIDDEEALKLASYALKIERHFGTPQDIEWAISVRGDIYILQSRPIVL